MTGLERRFRRGMAIELDGAPATIAKVSPGGRWIHVSTGPGHAMAFDESQARNRIRVPGENPELLLTPKQVELLTRVRETRGMFLHGTAEVRNGRRISLLGLVKLEDHGHMQAAIGSNRSDRERWWCTPVDGAAQNRAELAAARAKDRK